MSAELTGATAFTDKQAKFVQEYLIDMNAGQAAKRAGYAESEGGNLYSQGYRLLRTAHVKEAIEKALLARGDSFSVRQQDIVKELARIAFSDIRRVVTWNGQGTELVPAENTDDDAAAAISEISDRTTDISSRDGTTRIKREQRVKLYDKTKALDLLGRHLGIFVGDAGNTASPAMQLISMLASGAITMDDIKSMIPEKKP